MKVRAALISDLNLENVFECEKDDIKFSECRFCEEVQVSSGHR